MHNLSFLCTDSKATLVAHIREVINAVLHASLCCSIEGAIMGKQKVVDDVCRGFAFRLQPPEVKEEAISLILDADAYISVFEGTC